MLKRTRRYVFGGTVGVLVGLALGFVLAGQSAALQNKTPPPAHAAAGSSRTSAEYRAATGGAAKAPAPRQRVDTLAQQQFLATEEWKTTAADFDAWLGSQTFYDDARTAETALCRGRRSDECRAVTAFHGRVAEETRTAVRTLAQECRGIPGREGCRGFARLHETNS